MIGSLLVWAPTGTDGLAQRLEADIESLAQTSLVPWAVFAAVVVIAVLAALWGIGLAARTARALFRDPGHRVDRAVVWVNLAVVVVATFVALRPLVARAPLVIGVLLLSLAFIGARIAAEPLQNFLAGLALAQRKTFREGDVIALGPDFGTVEQIGLWRTLVVAGDGSHRWVPNRNLMGNEIAVATTAGVARVRVRVQLDAPLTPEQLERARRALITTPFRNPGGLFDVETASDSELVAELETWATEEADEIARRIRARLRVAMQVDRDGEGTP